MDRDIILDDNDGEIEIRSGRYRSQSRTPIDRTMGQPTRLTRPMPIVRRSRHGQREIFEETREAIPPTKAKRPEYQQISRSSNPSLTYTRQREIVETPGEIYQLSGSVETAVKRLGLIKIKDRAAKVKHYIKRLEDAVDDLKPGNTPRISIPIDAEDADDQTLHQMFNDAITLDKYETVVDKVEYEFRFVLSVAAEENEVGFTKYFVIDIESEVRQL